jgi:hypothetical protein
LVKIWNEQIFTPLFIAKKNNEDLENLLTGIKTNLNIQSGSILEKYLEAAIDRNNMKNFLSDLGLAYE